MSAPAAWPAYRDMTAEQMLEWGRAESAARQADLRPGTAASLERAQRNAEVRRRAIGATMNAAAAMVIAANRADRIARARSAS